MSENPAELITYLVVTFLLHFAMLGLLTRGVRYVFAKLRKKWTASDTFFMSLVIYAAWSLLIYHEISNSIVLDFLGLLIWYLIDAYRDKKIAARLPQ